MLRFPRSCFFALLQTHTAYYNVIGRQVDARLEELGGRRLIPLGLGDDSGCIELDWETWQANLLDTIVAYNSGGLSSARVVKNV